MAMSAKRTEQIIADIENELDHLERGLYAPRGIHWVCDKISWLWKFKHIDTATMHRLANRATDYMDGNY